MTKEKTEIAAATGDPEARIGVMSMHEVTLGKIIVRVQQRDAIHIAVAPVVAPVRLKPGQHVDQIGDPEGNWVGIVDPFLREDVYPGEWFWLLLYPNTVTTLRHEWTHPAFDAVTEANRSESEQWLRAFVARWNPQEYIDNIRDYYASKGENDAYPDWSHDQFYNLLLSEVQSPEGYFTAHGIGLHGRGDLGRDEERLFWHHVEIVTGKKFSASHRENFGWSCTC